MVTGVVTGAVVAGTPAIRIGNRLFALEDILEVRMAPGTTGATDGTGSNVSNGTGGGQTVLYPTGRTPAS
jgi:hypothetical protein